MCSNFWISVLFQQRIQRLWKRLVFKKLIDPRHTCLHNYHNINGLLKIPYIFIHCTYDPLCKSGHRKFNHYGHLNYDMTHINLDLSGKGANAQRYILFKYYNIQHIFGVSFKLVRSLFCPINISFGRLIYNFKKL